MALEDLTPRIETFKGFMQNPLGDGSTFQNKKVIYEGLYAKFSTLLRKKSNFKVRVFEIKDSIFIHVLVPSETIDNFFYDVVIEFKDSKGKANLISSPIKVFSNCPSFIFTFAFAFNKSSLLIEELKDKINKKALLDLPKVKNTEMVVGYEKSIFYAMFYIEHIELLKREHFSGMLIKTNGKQLNKIILSDEDKLKDYQNKKVKSDKAAADQKKKTKELFIDVHDERTTKRRRIYNRDGNNIKSKVNSKVNNKINNKLDNKVK